MWPLHARCTLSPLEHHQFTTRGRHSNIVVAFATRHVHKKELVRAPICEARVARTANPARNS